MRQRLLVSQHSSHNGHSGRHAGGQQAHRAGQHTRDMRTDGRSRSSRGPVSPHCTPVHSGTRTAANQLPQPVRHDTTTTVGSEACTRQYDVRKTAHRRSWASDSFHLHRDDDTHLSASYPITTTTPATTCTAGRPLVLSSTTCRRTTPCIVPLPLCCAPPLVACDVCQQRRLRSAVVCNRWKDGWMPVGRSALAGCQVCVREWAV